MSINSNTNEPPKNENRSKWMIGCGVGTIAGLCVVTFLVLGGLAGMQKFLNGEPAGLNVEVLPPPTEVMAGDDFSISVILSNVGTRNITITEIQLPNELAGLAMVKEVVPSNKLVQKDDNPNHYGLNLLIAPNCQQTVEFFFEAIQVGEISGDVRVYVGEKSTAAVVAMGISSDKTSVCDEGDQVADLPLVEAIPYRFAVQILVYIDAEGETKFGWSGSGTIISEDGLILANAHVVLSDRYNRVVDLIFSITQKEDQPSKAMFIVDILKADANVDLAVIKIRSDLDGNPVDLSTYGIPPVTLGDSNSIKLGDPLVILGYPVIGGQTITLTKGEVSGFTAQELYGNRAFIKTSATITGGNSGGLAATLNGEIIGVPTQMGSGQEDLN